MSRANRPRGLPGVLDQPLPNPFSGALGIGVTEGRRYWERGIDAVPYMTGAAAVMDARDLQDACARLHVRLPLAGRVLDIGCGTGRFQPYCTAWMGLDISRDAVAWAQRAGRTAFVMEGYGPAALDGWLQDADWIVCFSVFTHIGPEERHDYLEAFSRIAPALIVDIIPGDGLGDVAAWTADAEQFDDDLQLTGWQVQCAADRHSPDHVTHRYYHLTRRRLG